LTVAFDLVPLVDLCGRPSDVAAQIAQANETIGFLVVTGHEIDANLIAEMQDVTERFFDLPLEAKLAWCQPRPEISRGYLPPQSRSLAYSRDTAAPPDLVEYFAMGWLGTPANDEFHHANLWPDRPAHMQLVWTTYYRALERLANDLLSFFALALELPADHFEPTCRRHCSVLFANCYPPIEAEPQPGQLRLGPHSDYGSLTILYRDETPGGLQVSHKGRWENVPDMPGTYVVNIGDLMARWTNDRWVSTLHRVANPPAWAGSERRLSIPFFHQPDPEALIECLPTCQGPGNPARYEPITSGENYRAKTSKTLQRQ
jgi:isopenicillin N synthase-like dioxygenase